MWAVRHKTISTARYHKVRNCQFFWKTSEWVKQPFKKSIFPQMRMDSIVIVLALIYCPYIQPLSPTRHMYALFVAVMYEMLQYAVETAGGKLKSG